jgi:hypothetical protein
MTISSKETENGGRIVSLCRICSSRITSWLCWPSWAIRIDDARKREVAEVQILVPEVAAKRWREGVEKMGSSADILKFGITEPAERKFESSTLSGPGQARTVAHEEHQVTRRAKERRASENAGRGTKCRCATPVIFDLGFLSFLNSPAFEQKRQVGMTAMTSSSSLPSAPAALALGHARQRFRRFGPSAALAVPRRRTGLARAAMSGHRADPPPYKKKRPGVPKFGFWLRNRGDILAKALENPHVQRVESKFGTPGCRSST